MPPKKEKEEVVIQPSVEDFQLNTGEVDEVDPTKVDLIQSPIDPRWTDFILAQLEPSEKQDEHPRVDGLRRLVEKNVGPILSTELDIKMVPNNGKNILENSATVVVKVVVLNKFLGHKPSVTMSVADANPNTCTGDFANHLTAIAETRAKGRCYREILRLQNTVSAEELQGSKGDGLVSITDNQINFIDKLCQKLNLSVKDMIYGIAKKNPERLKEKPIISKYSKEEGIFIIECVNNFASSGKAKTDTPDYDPGWRSYFS